ncbi:helicase-exonuclease AddAB subunit AddB [Aquibacillus sp. 3ASR75-11]|uniref:ATP-dependent helicase/deoxyribonuclease subunit B n=1 Tax=Terrihalobacillus insolitus TaxID=2950438 RepID=A0A9X3WTC5_9BACI|nr:helicase-exonuclease AddAB subunit AddB [Terrihalobacillus insolitus]MDC3425592.1 helicase-exonuclease AddAB subunit AddB [Terrihalobacillus insolitus]
MGLRFLFGQAGAGKSDRCLAEIEDKLHNNPNGAPIYYIVPDQMTFQQEYSLLKRKKINGSIRAQVFSFSRLAWRVLQETGGSTRKFISSTGIQMMLRKIAEEKKQDWNVFQKAMEKQGFIEQLEGMITEFKRYRITPEMLQMEIAQMDRFTHKHPGEVALQHKLEDLNFIYEKLMDALKDTYIDSEDQLRLLADKIETADFLSDSEIYLDGFHRFTPQELEVVEALLKKVRQVTVTLTVDDPTGAPISELDLFCQTKETYQQLTSSAKECQITIDEMVHLDQESGRFDERPYFAHLENYFDVRPSPTFEGAVPIQLAQAVHPRAEVEGAAQEILRLVREEQYRFKDIAVLIRQTELYHDLIKTVFQDYGIPVFIDEKRTMMNHPLLELIRSGLDVIEGNWRYDAVFRMLKTGFIPITDNKYPLDVEAIDELENYVLEYGIRSKDRWCGDKQWIFQRFRGFDQASQTDEEKDMQRKMNRYRYQVVRAFQPFEQQMSKAKTIAEKCQAIYEWLESLGVPKQLEKIRNDLDSQGRIEHGREQEQVWNAVIQLMDEIVEMVGDEEMTLPIFRSTLESGFESLKFAHVPPSMDHVVTGTIDRSRIGGIKCAFLLGVNDGVWPKKPAGDGMITEEERELLAEHGIKLADGSKRQLLDDWFYVYLAFTAAQDRLWVSYPLSDEEGKSKSPSQLIKRIQDLFPACQDLLLLQDADEMKEADRFISTPIKTRSALTSQLARNARGYPVDPIWNNVLNWYIQHHAKSSTTYTILQSLFYKNEPTYLSKETTEQLYPKEVKASVSRLEMYHRCSYQHFARYSLGLEERRTYKLDAPDIGQLFHEALKKITEWLQAEGKDYSQMNQDQAKQYANRAVESLGPILQHQILHSSNRYQYIQQKLQEVIARAAYVLSEQARQSQFSTVGLELSFGPNQELAPIKLSLPNGYELQLRGRIDRVDRAIDQEQLFLRIIDYKSSSKGLNLSEVYYGLALQMLAYLDVVLSQSEKWLGEKATPAGVLYFHVHNPILSKSKKLTDMEIEQELFKKFKMQGLLVENEQVIRMMDTSLDSGTSKIIPAGLKKNGELRKGSNTAQRETFQQLQGYIRELMVGAGMDMTSGNVHLNPYQQKQQTACAYCSFHSVCQFDASLVENNFRRLKDLKDEEVIEAIVRRGDS